MKKPISITAANGLYLASMLLVAAMSIWMQMHSFSWGPLVIELACVLLPTLVFFRAGKTGPGGEHKLALPNWKIGLVSLMMGSGCWMVGVYLNSLGIGLQGLRPSLEASLQPATPWQAAWVFLGVALAAPVCEQLLFSGTLQPAYERFGPLVGILVSGLFFAFFHLRLLGLISLIPLGLLLGYTFYRTRSIASAMVLQFGNNVLAAGLIIAGGLFPKRVPQLPTLSSAGFGLLVILTCLILLTRLTGKPAVVRRPGHEKAWAWLLLALAACVWVGMMVVQALSLHQSKLMYLPIYP